MTVLVATGLACWGEALGSVLSPAHRLHRESRQLFCQVTGVADGPEQRAARRRSVRLTVQGWPGPFATGRIPANHMPHHSERSKRSRRTRADPSIWRQVSVGRHAGRAAPERSFWCCQTGSPYSSPPAVSRPQRGEDDDSEAATHTPEQVVRKLRAGERMLNVGKDLAEVLRHLDIAESTWKHAQGTSTAG